MRNRSRIYGSIILSVDDYSIIGVIGEPFFASQRVTEEHIGQRLFEVINLSDLRNLLRQSPFEGVIETEGDSKRVYGYRFEKSIYLMVQECSTPDYAIFPLIESHIRDRIDQPGPLGCLLSRMELYQSTTLTPEPTEVEARSVVEQSLETLQLSIDRLKLTISIDGEATLWVDRGRFEAAVLILLTEAIEKSELKGSIDIVIESVDEMVSIRVEDSGLGLDPDFREEWLQPFTSNGTALDLYRARVLVEQMNGWLTLDSLGLGSGTVAQIRIPAGAPDDSGAEKITETRTILLVDDNDTNRELLEIIIDDLFPSAVITSVDGAKAALDHLASVGAVDVIITDIHMPEMNGYELVEKLREDGYHGYIIACTADVTPAVAPKCESVGTDAVIYKPVDFEQLEQMISPVFEHGGSKP